jgi:hypothetical protein
MLSFLPVMLTVLVSQTSSKPTPAEVTAERPPDAFHRAGGRVRGGMELLGELLPSGIDENGMDGFGVARPIMGFSVGDAFALELGPTFRFRILDTAPSQRGADLGGTLRPEDWDELSDFGQILQNLTVGAFDGPFLLQVGAVRKKTLGLGHLVNRYSNQENPNYHPAGATGRVGVGPIRGEMFASDVLGARLFAGEVAWDVTGTFSPREDWRDRIVLSLELAHDAARAGIPRGFGASPTFARLDSISLVESDVSAMLISTQGLRMLLFGGAGARLKQHLDVGLVFGAAADVTAGMYGVSLKAEYRKNAGGFRQGMFGPTYELSRFADIGREAAPIGAVALPDASSFYGEARLGVGSFGHVDAALEHFFTGRTDIDATASVRISEAGTTAFGRLSIVGLGDRPRYAWSAGVRARFLSSLYAVATAGSVYFPQADGSLLGGVTFATGIGVDFEG